MSIGKKIAIAGVWIGYAAIMYADIFTIGIENTSATTVGVGIFGAMVAIFASVVISKSSYK